MLIDFVAETAPNQFETLTEEVSVYKHQPDFYFPEGGYEVRRNSDGENLSFDEDLGISVSDARFRLMDLHRFKTP